MLYNAVEKLAIDNQKEKIVLYHAGDSKKFWTNHKFIEEPDDEEKYYKVDEEIYKGPGVRMEKNITEKQDNSSAYVVLEESNKLKKIFSGIPRIFGSEVIPDCGKSTKNVSSGLGLLEITSSVAAEATVAAVEMVAAEATVTAKTNILRNDIQEERIPPILAEALQYTLF